MKGKTAIRTVLPLVITFTLVATLPLFAKSKDDVVVMKNGDRLTGEIKGLQHGELIFKSSYMTESVHLNWDEVEKLSSRDRYIVALVDGKRVSGTIEKKITAGGGRASLEIAAEGSTIEVSQHDIVGIQQQEASFWQQLTGSISYGFSFASANSHVNSALGLDVAYSTPRNSVKLSTSSQFDSQSQGENARRFAFDSQYGRLLTQKWAALGLFDLLRSNQQDLDLRSTYGAGFGRKMISTDKTTLLVLGGSAYTHERYFPQLSAEPVRNSAEGVFGIQLSTFRFRTLDLTSQCLLFPSFSELGRVRISSQSGLRIELVRNFFWGLQLYENYDSRPPVIANKNDLGVNTSLGWKF